MISQDNIDALNEEKILLDKHHITMLVTKDPDNQLMGEPIPALTTLWIEVCDKDREKFDEATRLITLFMEKAEEKANG